QQLAQRHVLERYVDARADPAGRELDQRRHADPDRARAIGASVLDRADQLLDELVLAAELRAQQVRLGQLAGLERRGGDLRPADVDPDELVAHRPAAAASRY